MIGERILKLRKELGIGQVDFAAATFISQGYLSELEKGKKVASKRVVFVICQKYGINEKWLVEGNGPKTSKEAGTAAVLSKAEEGMVERLRNLKKKGASREVIVKAMDRYFI